MITFNILGAVMILTPLLISFGVRYVTGTSEEGPGDGPEFLMLGGLAILFDASYRIRQSDGHWISPFGGGNILFIPVWVLGGLWGLSGVVHCFLRPIPADKGTLALIGLVTAAALGLTLYQIARSERPNFSKFLASLTSAQRPESTMDTRPKERPRKNLRCPACHRPCERQEAADSQCPWCGANIDEAEREDLERDA